MSTRLEKAREKAAQAEARVKHLEAIERTKRRKRENRKALLYGRVILAAIENGDFTQAELNKLADKYTVKTSDRVLLELAVSETRKPRKTQSKANAKLGGKSAMKPKKVEPVSLPTYQDSLETEITPDMNYWEKAT